MRLTCVILACAAFLLAGYSDVPKDVKASAISHLRLPEYEVKLVQSCYELMVESTAYWHLDPVDASGTGLAFDGRPAIPFKTVAVDPSVIPIGSNVYVPDIGWCYAHDTGSAIKGARLDVAMDSRESAYKWGRRNILVKVYPPEPVMVAVIEQKQRHVELDVFGRERIENGKRNFNEFKRYAVPADAEN